MKIGFNMLLWTTNLVEDQFDLLKKIKFLLKDQGMTINGVKKILESKESLPLDELANKSIKTEKLRLKLLKISHLIKKLKDNK